MFKVGTELRYTVRKTVDGRPEGVPYENVCRVTSVDGDSTGFGITSEVDGPMETTVVVGDGTVTVGNTVFGKVPGTPIQVEMGDCVVYVDTMVPAPRCGGGETVFLGRDGIIYKAVRRQLWSRGVVCEITYRLVSVTVQGIVYDGIRWVDEGESPEEDPDL